MLTLLHPQLIAIACIAVSLFGFAKQASASNHTIDFGRDCIKFGPFGLAMDTSTSCLIALRNDPVAKGVFVTAIKAGIAEVEARSGEGRASQTHQSSSTAISLQLLAEKSIVDGVVRRPYFGAK